MRSTLARAFGLTLAVGAGLASIASAAPTVKFTISSAGDSSLGGESTSPYFGNVNGGKTVPIICDDFADSVSPIQKWDAFATDLSAFDGTTLITSVYFAQGGTAAQQTQAYIAAAILSSEILGAADKSQARNDLSYALWALFDPPALNSISGADKTNAQLDENNAITMASSYANGLAYENANTKDIIFYTPTFDGISVATNPPPSGSGLVTRPQEFVLVPEPSAWAVLALDLAGAGLVGLLFRRRLSAKNS